MLSIDRHGQIELMSGVTSPGGGNETALAQLVAAELGVRRDRVFVVQGDTDRCPSRHGQRQQSGGCSWWGSSCTRRA